MAVKPRAPAVCIHHFVLEDANGPTSVGVCKKCGEQREFKNAVPDAWDRAIARRRGVKNIGRRPGCSRVSEEAK